MAALAALFQSSSRGVFPNRTGVYCWVQSRRNPIVFDFTIGKVCSLPLKSGRLNVGVAYLPVPALWKEICTIPMDKKLSQMKWNVMV